MKDIGFECNEVENSLPLYAGDDLEPQARASIEVHLGLCARCRKRALAARTARERLVGALSGVGRRAPDLWPGVRAALVAEGRIRSDGREPGQARSPRRPAWRHWPWVPVGAAAAAAVVLGLWLGRSGDGNLEPSPRGGPPIVVPVDGVPADNGPGPGPDELQLGAGLRAQTVVALPVGTGRGLRRVGTNEAALSDTAEVYVPELGSPSPRGRDAYASSPSSPSSPASLQIVRPIH